MTQELDQLAKGIFISLLGNEKRYEYIAGQIDQGTLTQDQATLKNINKAYRLAESFLEARDKKRSGLGIEGLMKNQTMQWANDLGPDLYVGAVGENLQLDLGKEKIQFTPEKLEWFINSLRLYHKDLTK